MRLCSSEQPAHISLIRRRSRSIVSVRRRPREILDAQPDKRVGVNIGHEVDGAVTKPLDGWSFHTAGSPERYHDGLPTLWEAVVVSERGAGRGSVLCFSYHLELATRLARESLCTAQLGDSLPNVARTN